MEEVVSVIVPVYNVEDKLEECITSILNQTYKNLDIILVDDGSFDSSGKLCDKYVKAHKNIRCIHKKNEGLGLARNTALEYIEGKYVVFVDSDDSIKKEMIHDMLKVVQEYHVDMVATSFIYNGTPQLSLLEKGIYKGSELRDVILTHMMGNQDGRTDDQFNVSACTKLYAASVIKNFNIRFPCERQLIWEDMAFNFDFICNCSQIYILDNAYYYYHYNENSITHTYDPDKFIKLMGMYTYLAEKIKQLDLSEQAYVRLRINFMGNIRTCFKLETLYAEQNGKCNAIRNLRKMLNSSQLQKMVREIPMKRQTLQQNIISCFIKIKSSYGVYFLSKLQNARKGGLIN